MLDMVFIKVVNMSFTASYVILAVLLLRLFLQKAPKIFSYALWGVALFRLLCPFSFESAISWFGITERVGKMAPLQPRAVYDLPTTVLPQTAVSVDVPLTVSAGGSWFSDNVFALLWLLGMVALLLYAGVSLWRLHRKLRSAVWQTANSYTVKQLTTPFVFGMLRPKIYLPEGLGEVESTYILCHEQTHIKRFDQIWRGLAYLALCLHWFNPLVWLASYLSGRDLEMSCDERVIKTLGYGAKQGYSSSLLALATGRREFAGWPLAFGRGDTKDRIKNVLQYHRPALGVSVGMVVVLSIVCITLAANPKTGSGLANALPVVDTVAEIRVTGVEPGGEAALLVANQQPELAALYAYLAQGTETKRQSVQDVPAAEAYIRFALLSGGETITLFFYEQAGKYYLEQPYQGVWQLEQPVAEALLALVKGEQQQGAVPVTAALDALFEQLQQGPQASASPADYIAANPKVYDEILAYGDSALLYCFRQFAAGGQTGLKGQLMQGVCQQLCQEEASGLQADNGQQWYAAFQAKASGLEQQLGRDELDKHAPKAWLLLQLLSGQLDAVQAAVRLPDFEYQGGDAILRLVYTTEVTQYQASRLAEEDSFLVPAVQIHQVVSKGDKLKIFATIYDDCYQLNGKDLVSVSGSVVPVAITYTQDSAGNYQLEAYLQAADGSNFAPSVEAYCTDPVSGKIIPGLAAEILDNYTGYEDLQALQKENLIAHLQRYEQTGVSLVTEYDDSVTPLT